MRYAPSSANNCGQDICPLAPGSQEAADAIAGEANYLEQSVQAEEVLLWLKRLRHSFDVTLPSATEIAAGKTGAPLKTLACALKISDGECRAYGWKKDAQGVVELRPKLRLV